MKNVIFASMLAACLIFVVGCKGSDDTAAAAAADGAATNPTTPVTKSATKAAATSTPATNTVTLGPGAGGADTRVGSATTKH